MLATPFAPSKLEPSNLTREEKELTVLYSKEKAEESHNTLNSLS
jgi:hypothetical protein